MKRMEFGSLSFGMRKTVVVEWFEREGMRWWSWRGSWLIIG